MFERGNFEDALTSYDLVETICKEHGSEMSDLLADNHFCKAAAAANMNRAGDVLFHSEQALALRLASGKRDCNMGIAYGEHGIALVMAKRYTEAIQECQTSIAISKPLAEAGIMRLPNSQAHITIGFARCLLGQYREAEEILLVILSQLEEKQRNDFK